MSLADCSFPELQEQAASGGQPTAEAGAAATPFTALSYGGMDFHGISSVLKQQQLALNNGHTGEESW